MLSSGDLRQMGSNVGDEQSRMQISVTQCRVVLESSSSRFSASFWACPTFTDFRGHQLLKEATDFIEGRHNLPFNWLPFKLSLWGNLFKSIDWHRKDTDPFNNFRLLVSSPLFNIFNHYTDYCKQKSKHSLNRNAMSFHFVAEVKYEQEEYQVPRLQVWVVQKNSSLLTVQAGFHGKSFGVPELTDTISSPFWLCQILCVCVRVCMLF